MSPQAAAAWIMISKLSPFGCNLPNSGCKPGVSGLLNHSSALAQSCLSVADRRSALKASTEGL
eukprot:CAMPEP_0183537992 /NCGR_PEP_ID=MMETSP0371-20130417/29286_1 /TAXON_ID=268820 /ORGANISM="Peridinium aciculiferum, Strain PAER-2" /LENGTH=62 /DNA_ID=CAMNT_0025738769 /DNA_START=238 /DNA_END=426 /DNA_ORIENTATION=-